MFLLAFWSTQNINKNRKKEKDTFIQVIINPGDIKTVRFDEVSAWQCPLYKVLLLEFIRKRPGPKVVVGLSKVFVSEHVRFN